MNALYLLLLVAALACMALVDRRWRLAFWCDARRAAIVLAAGESPEREPDPRWAALGDLRFD